MLFARLGRHAAFLALVGYAGLACGPTGPHDSANGQDLAGKLVVTGSSTVAPVVAEIAIAFEALHPGVRVDVQSGGSSRGISDARSGVADVGMASRALARDELDLVAQQIARDGVTLIVNAGNSVGSLTDAQVVGIYTGRITDWSELGGLAGPITVIHKAAGRATRDVFLGYFHIDERDVEPDVVVGENEQGIKTVAGNRGAIGYVSIGTALAAAGAGAPVRLLPISGIAPDPARVAIGEFPLSRPLLLLTGPAPSRLARSFIEFATSSQAAPIIRAQHFVPTPHVGVAQ